MLLLSKRILLIAAALAGLLGVCAAASRPSRRRSDRPMRPGHFPVRYPAGGAATPRWSTRAAIWSPTCRRTRFTVYENGVAAADQDFKREDVPVSMGLIIDNSGSMRDKRAKVEAAALALVKASNPRGRSLHREFQRRSVPRHPHGKDFTNNIKELEEALTRIDSRGGTAMRDAIRMSIDHLKEKGKKDKKVLVVVTDGNDNSSVDQPGEPGEGVAAERSADLSVGLLSEEERREAKRAERALNDLAEATGGEVFFPKDAAEVERIAHAGGARHPQPVHHPIHADEPGDGRHVPPDQGGGQRAGQVRRPARAAATTPPRTRIHRPRARRRSNNVAHALASHAGLPAGARGAVPICAGAWRPTGECTRTRSRFAISGDLRGYTAGNWCGICGGRSG